MLSEKYRPKSLDDVIGQEHIVVRLKAYVKAEDFPHMLFYGPPGTGKTSTAHAFAAERGWPIVEFNASDDRTLDFVRSKIKPLALSAGNRIVLLDEADSMIHQAQFALRRLMEKAAGTRFILTANNVNAIIDAIRSRCANFEFRPLKSQQVSDFVVRVLKNEGVRFQSKDDAVTTVKWIVEVSQGDLRKLMNLLEQSVVEGNLNVDYIKSLVDPNLISGVIKLALTGNLNDALKRLTDLYYDSGQDVSIFLQKMFGALMELNPELRAPALIEFARAEQAIRTGSNPLFQLASVVARIFYEVMRK